MAFPELWQPVGIPVQRTFVDEELLILAGLALTRPVTEVEIYVQPDSAPFYAHAIPRDFRGEGFTGKGSTKEEAWKSLAQQLVDKARGVLRDCLTQAGPSGPAPTAEELLDIFGNGARSVSRGAYPCRCLDVCIPDGVRMGRPHMDPIWLTHRAGYVAGVQAVLDALIVHYEHRGGS